MFTGIIEAQGELVALRKEGTNVHLDIRAPFTSDLQVDQSVAHDGVCLTVVATDGDVYTVTAIEETLAKRTSERVKSAMRSIWNGVLWLGTASMAILSKGTLTPQAPYPRWKSATEVGFSRWSIRLLQNGALYPRAALP